jgi:hypothetical protein
VALAYAVLDLHEANGNVPSSHREALIGPGVMAWVAMSCSFKSQIRPSSGPTGQAWLMLGV